jgi:catechol 2,3-dioxygenase-like lactoylglutathione lyase family enzyme
MQLHCAERRGLAAYFRRHDAYAPPVFDRLDFVYQPSRDVAADLAFYVDRLGAQVVFTVERFATRVAMLRVSDDGPHLLLAEHLEGDAPVLVYRVDDLAAARERLPACAPFEFPFGDGLLLSTPAPQRIAVYERTQAERGASLTGRRDF